MKIRTECFGWTPRASSASETKLVRVSSPGVLVQLEECGHAGPTRYSEEHTSLEAHVRSVLAATTQLSDLEQLIQPWGLSFSNCEMGQ